MALKGEHVTCVALGSGDSQTVCSTASNLVFSWGDGDYGKLGRGGNEGSKVPKKVDGLTGKPVVKMLCGSQFAIVLTANGHVYTWYELNTVGAHLPEVLVVHLVMASLNLSWHTHVPFRALDKRR